MSRYIDKEILKNKILNDMAKAEREGKDLNGYTDALFHLKTIPTPDVVEVVRCKDCKHYGGVTFGGVCHKYSGCDTKICTEADHYCSYGERK